ncbi:MAG: hypothetical protein AAFY54_07225 [Cyanobacteria bacterium J06648_10]
MNDPRKNHDHLVCQEAQTPQYPVEIIGIKSILLYWLNCFLSSEYKEKRKSFTDFSHNSKEFSDSCTQADEHVKTSTNVDWSKIPLQKRPTENSVLYTSALPQIFSIDNVSLTATSQKVKPQQIVNQLNQFQRQSSEQYLSAEESILHFLSTLWQAFEISGDRAGWISFRLSENGITKWLEHIIQNDPVCETHHTLVIHQLSANYPISPSASGSQKKPPKKPQKSRNIRSPFIETGAHHQQLWQAQHTYARCCSFIHRGTHGGARTAHYASESIHADETPAGLNQRQRSPSSQQLVQQLVEISDDMFWIPYRYPSKQYLLLLKSMTKLCQAFERFQREDLPGFSHDGYSEQLHSHAPPVITHLGLVVATRNILKPLLQSVFQTVAPEVL